MIRTVSFFGSSESAMRGRALQIICCARRRILSLLKFFRRDKKLRPIELCQQIVTARARDSPGDEFTNGRRFRQNNACVHVGRVRFGPRDQSLIH